MSDLKNVIVVSKISQTIDWKNLIHDQLSDKYQIEEISMSNNGEHSTTLRSNPPLFEVRDTQKTADGAKLGAYKALFALVNDMTSKLAQNKNFHPIKVVSLPNWKTIHNEKWYKIASEGRVGFGCEWTNQDQTDRQINETSKKMYKIATIQISTLRKTIIVKLNDHPIPDAVKELLENENVMKFIYGNKMHKVLLEQMGVNPKGFVDIEELANSLGMERRISGYDNKGFATYCIRGLSNTYYMLTGVENIIDKSIGSSNWSRERLTIDQIKFAASDSRMTSLCGEILMRHMDNINNNKKELNVV